VEKVVGSLKTA